MWIAAGCSTKQISDDADDNNITTADDVFAAFSVHWREVTMHD